MKAEEKSCAKAKAEHGAASAEAQGGEAQSKAGVLYLVGMPIGNDADLSPRARAVLGEVDLIACEDTRTSGLILSRLGIAKPRLSYHAHNWRTREAQILELLRAGRRVALISDAGMPCVSDPGSELVRACVEAQLPVSVLPGPSAGIAALALSAMDCRRFVFEGFLESKGRERRERLAALALESRTIILYEAPHRLTKTLADLLALGLGERRLSLARELTKRYEEVLYLTLVGAVGYYSEREPRGEYVLVLEGAEEAAKRLIVAPPVSDESVLADARWVEAELARGEAVKTIAKTLAERGSLTRGEAYERVQRIKDRRGV